MIGDCSRLARTGVAVAALLVGLLSVGSGRVAAQAADIAVQQALRQQLEAQVGTLGGDVTALQNALAATQAEVTARRAELAKAQVEAKAKADQLVAAAAEVAAKLEVAGKELADRDATLAAHQRRSTEQLSELENGLATKTRELEQRGQQLAAVSKEIAEQEARQAENARIAAEVAAKLAEAKAGVDSLQKQASDLAKLRDASILDAKQKLAAIEKSVQTGGSQEGLQAELAAALGAMGKTQADLTTTMQQLEQRRAQLAAVEADLAQRKAAAAAARAAPPAAAPPVQLASVGRQAQAGDESPAALALAMRSAFAGQPAIRRVGDRTAIPADLLFGPGRTKISAEGEQIAKGIAESITQAAASLPAQSPWFVLVTAHSDSAPLRKGSPYESNRAISLERAFNLVEALTAAGVPGLRLVATGVGPDQPAYSGDDALAKALNRRVEVELVMR